MIYLGDQAVGLATSIPEFADIAKIECGNYTPVEDILVSSINFNYTMQNIPDFIFIYSELISDNGNNWEKSYLLQSLSTNYPLDQSEQVKDYYMFTTNYTRVDSTSYRSTYGGALKTDFVGLSSFKIPLSGSTIDMLYLKANTTYHYIIGKFKEVTSNAS